MKKYKTTIDELKLKRIKSEFSKAKITNSRTAAEYAKQFYGDDLEIYESMFLILLNRAHNTTGFVKISQGGIAGTVCDVKLIAKYAIESLASSVILCHNHPTGNLKPSEADKMQTKKVKNALNYLDVNLIDHLILTKNSYTSLADQGLI